MCMKTWHQYSAHHRPVWQLTSRPFLTRSGVDEKKGDSNGLTYKWGDQTMASYLYQVESECTSKCTVLLISKCFQDPSCHNGVSSQWSKRMWIFRFPMTLVKGLHSRLKNRYQIKQGRCLKAKMGLYANDACPFTHLGKQVWSPVCFPSGRCRSGWRFRACCSAGGAGADCRWTDQSESCCGAARCEPLKNRGCPQKWSWGIGCAPLRSEPWDVRLSPCHPGCEWHYLTETNLFILTFNSLVIIQPKIISCVHKTLT